MLATVPNPIFEQLLDAAPAPTGWRPATSSDCADRVPRRAVPRAGARPALRALLLDQRRRHEIPFLGLIEQTNFVDPAALRRAGASSTWRTTCRPATRCSALDPDELLERLRAGAAQDEPRLRALVGEERAGCSREPDAQPHRHRRATASGSRRCETGVPGLVLANTTQVYPGGSGHQLRGPSRPRGGGDSAGGSRGRGLRAI